MKRILAWFLVVVFLFTVTGCGKDQFVKVKTPQGESKEYKFQQIGLFDENEKRNPQVEYRVIVGNVIWAILLFETVAAPIIIFGWYLWEPVGPKYDGVPGVVGVK